MALPPEVISAGLSCVDHDHYAVGMLNEVFNIDVDKMFTLVFSDCPLQKVLSQQRHRTDVVWNPWQLEADGFQRRDVTYTVTVPRQAKSYEFTEKQSLYPESRPGLLYLVDAECLSATVPYGDSFSVVERCYITKVSENSCQLCITCEINFMKSLWGPVKSLISEMAVENILKHFQALAVLLRKQDPSYEQSDSETSDALEEPAAEVIISEYFEDISFYYTGIIYFVFTGSIFCLVCVVGVFSYGLWNSLDRMSFMSTRILDKQRRSHINFSHPHVHTIADDLVAQLSELLASATKLIEATTESLEELTERKAEEQKDEQKEEVKETKEEEAV